jgi:hypothetical protein
MMMAAAWAQRGQIDAAVRAAEYFRPYLGGTGPFDLFAAAVFYREAPPDVQQWLGPVIRAKLDAGLPGWLQPYQSNRAWVGAATALLADGEGIGTYAPQVLAWAAGAYAPIVATEHGYGGDLRTWPLAYNAFTAVFLTVAADRPEAPDMLMRTAVSACRVIERTTSPRGMVAWYGRSHLQSWAEAAAIVALRACEGYSSADAGHFEAVVHAIHRALNRSYPELADGRISTVPRAALDADDVSHPYRGADNYAHPVDYNAWTLVLLGLVRPAAASASAPRTGFVAAMGDAEPAVVSISLPGGWLGVSARRGWSRLGAPTPIDGRTALGVQRAETAAGRVIVPAAALGGPADFDLPSAVSATRHGNRLVLRGPGYAMRVAIQGCAVLERLTVSRSRTVVVGARVAFDDEGRRLQAVSISQRPRGHVRRWRAYGADAYRLDVTTTPVRVHPSKPLVVIRKGCL